MGLGTSIFMIAAGAILRYAVTDTEVWILELDVIGLILMIVGILGLILSLYAQNRATDGREQVIVERDRIPPR